MSNVRQVKEFKDIFVANLQHFSYLKDKSLRLEELLAYPILMLDKQSMTSEFLHSLFQQRQLDLVPEVELSSNDLLIDLARIGLGIAFVPDFCLPKNDPDEHLRHKGPAGGKILPQLVHAPDQSAGEDGLGIYAQGKGLLRKKMCIRDSHSPEPRCAAFRGWYGGRQSSA